MKVHEAMTGDVCLVDPDRSIREAARMMADQDIGALPVGENDRLVGMITDRDLAVRALAQGLGPDTKIRDVMSPEVMYCFEDEDLDDAVHNMGDIKVRRLPVLNRNKRLVGILSISDVAHREDASKTGQAIADISAPSGRPGRIRGSVGRLRMGAAGRPLTERQRIHRVPNGPSVRRVKPSARSSVSMRAGFLGRLRPVVSKSAGLARRGDETAIVYA